MDKEMEGHRPIELLSDGELIEALLSRYDELLIVGSKKRTQRIGTGTTAFTSPASAIGLARIALQEIPRIAIRAEEEVERSEDDDF